MKVVITIPDETLDAAVAVFSMKCKKQEEKAQIKEAHNKAKQAEAVEIPTDLLKADGDDEDFAAMYFALDFAALATFLKNE